MALERAATRRPATMYDVAELAGVSHQTVSRLLRGFEGIRPETRTRVEAAIAQLNYRPNLTARSLATSRSYRIGALTHELLEVGPSKILDGASHGARDAGYMLDIVSLDPSDPDAIDRAIRLIGQHELAGVIAFAPTDALVSVFQDTDFAVPLYIDAEVGESVDADAITLNGRAEAVVVEHLVALGHTRFLHVGGPAEWISSRNRAAIYERVLARNGLRSIDTLTGDWSSASGYAAGLRIPVDGSVTAVVAANDQMAFGVLRALLERGVRVPEQISVVGFDDIPEAAYFTPSLTTIGIDFDQQGKVAIARLIAEIEGSRVPLPQEPTPVLRARESSGPAPR